ncbi:MAG: helix-turn-helix domain-containing protein [Pseudomonadota bacterium]
MAASRMIKRGELADRSGCNIETIRYYENIGLLKPPERTPAGHRLYSRDDRARLSFILRGRDLGFSIEELKSLLSLVDSHDYSCGEVLDLTRDHLASVRQKIADLKKLERTLADVSAQCEGGDVPECPIIDALFGHEVGLPD